jgi:hypothetical protein
MALRRPHPRQPRARCGSRPPSVRGDDTTADNFDEKAVTWDADPANVERAAAVARCIAASVPPVYRDRRPGSAGAQHQRHPVTHAPDQARLAHRHAERGAGLAGQDDAADVVDACDPPMPARRLRRLRSAS